MNQLVSKKDAERLFDLTRAEISSLTKPRENRLSVKWPMPVFDAAVTVGWLPHILKAAQRTQMGTREGDPLNPQEVAQGAAPIFFREGREDMVQRIQMHLVKKRAQIEKIVAAHGYNSKQVRCYVKKIANNYVTSAQATRNKKTGKWKTRGSDVLKQQEDEYSDKLGTKDLHGFNFGSKVSAAPDMDDDEEGDSFGYNDKGDPGSDANYGDEFGADVRETRKLRLWNPNVYTREQVEMDLETLRECRSRLPAIWERVLECRYPIADPDAAMTEEETARLLGLKRHVVRDLEKRAISFLRMAMIHAEETLDARRVSAAETFLAERPDFIKNPRTAQRLKQYFEAAGFDGTDPDHFHDAFNSLVSHGLAEAARTPATARTRYSQTELEEMPLSDLEELANRAAYGVQD